MRILLVEPNYRKEKKKRNNSSKGKIRDDETLWYPPLGLMKLSRFHKNRGDEVRFVSGCDSNLFRSTTLFSLGEQWDRVYITTVFTFHFKKIIETINFYIDALGGTLSKIYVGGIMASLMPNEIFQETGIFPKCGTLCSPKEIDLSGSDNIDLLVPDYNLLDPSKYAINDTYYGYTTRGCTNKCPWCGVPTLEPDFISYIDIKPMIKSLRIEHGDKSTLKLMDNNVLASPELDRIIDDLLELGYGRGETTITTKRKRIVDFNQGLDASHINEHNMKLLSKINVKPLRVAFDRLSEKKDYIRALKLAQEYGVDSFSNYMLYNFHDTPRDLYERLMVNIELNEKWMCNSNNLISGKIYSYPMRYAPIKDVEGDGSNRKRDIYNNEEPEKRNWKLNPSWTRRFMRSIEIMKGAANGAISPTPSLARRTIGESFDEYIANLYMPEELLRNRNQHEKKIYEHEPKRISGTGKVEEFRSFILKLIEKQDERFLQFHKAVVSNSIKDINESLKTIKDKEIIKWLQFYKRQT